MKLFIVGSDKIYAIENFYVKYLREAGVEVIHFPAQSYFYDYYQGGIVNKFLYRAGISGILKKINNRFIAAIEKYKPDIIWIFKGMEIFPSSLEWAKQQGIKLVNFNGDSPFVFSGKGSGNKNVTNSIHYYDLFLTYNRKDKKQMQAQYQIKSEILPFGYDLKNSLYKECEEIAEVKKVCFLGNPDSLRGAFLNELAAQNVKIDVYGNNWNKFVNHSNIELHGPVYGDKFWRILRKYRVQLNLMRPHNSCAHNMRTFEAGGVGAIQLAFDTTDHRMYFKENEEIFLFNDVTSCCSKIDKIMNLTTDKAKKIRERARLRSQIDGYSYEIRSVQALTFLNGLDNKK